MSNHNDYRAAALAELKAMVLLFRERGELRWPVRAAREYVSLLRTPRDPHA